MLVASMASGIPHLILFFRGAYSKTMLQLIILIVYWPFRAPVNHFW